jgi:uncharacterized membrane protein YqaE (UPF0057 family)
VNGLFYNGKLTHTKNTNETQAKLDDKRVEKSNSKSDLAISVEAQKVNEIVNPSVEQNDNNDLAISSNELIITERNATLSERTNVETLKATKQVENVNVGKSTISKIEKKAAVKKVKKSAGGDVPVGLLYVLCLLMPWLAVGLATDWDIKKVIINILWSFLCGIPGIIHAFIVVSKNN